MCCHRWQPSLTTHPAVVAVVVVVMVQQLTHPRSRSPVSQLQTLSQMKPTLAVAGLQTVVAVVVAVVVTGRHTLSWVCRPCRLPCPKVCLPSCRHDLSEGAFWCCTCSVVCMIISSACHALCNQTCCVAYACGCGVRKILWIQDISPNEKCLTPVFRS